MCVEEYGVDIINDIAAGGLDEKMFETVASLNVPYIIMHMKGNPRTMQLSPHYDDIMSEVTLYFSEKINKLRGMGVNDIIIDPGFGFSKTTDHNFQLMSRMQELNHFNLPILVGISRKSMIYHTLDISPQQSLNGTTMLNTIALEKGANILRVHDVAECVEVVKLYNKLKVS
ncbi:MAG: dihydropteroate synthase, partial [Bacteroidaceae bacterium]